MFIRTYCIIPYCIYISVHVFPLHCNLRPFSHSKLIRMAMGYGMLGVLPGCLSPRTWAISRLRLRRSLQFVQAIQANEMITWPWHFHAFCSILLHFGKGGLLHRKNWISDTLQLQSQPGKCFPLSDITDNTTEIPACVFFQSPLSILIISTTQARNPYNIFELFKTKTTQTCLHFLTLGHLCTSFYALPRMIYGCV